MTDPRYSTFSYKFQNSGLSARYIYDNLPPGKYLNLQNLECRQEGALSSRYGLAALSTDGINNFPLGAPVNTLGRMQGLLTPFNYAKADGSIYRKNTDGIGSYGPAIGNGSNNRMSMAPYRPNATSNPYMFMADSQVLLKDSGLPTVIANISTITHAGGGFSTTATVTVNSTAQLTNGGTYTIAGNSAPQFNGVFVVTVTSPTTFTIPFVFAIALSGMGGTVNIYGTTNWGIAPPTQPALIAPATAVLSPIETFDEAATTSFTLVNLGSPAMVARVTYSSGTPAVAAPGVVFVPINILAGVTLSRTTGVTTATIAGHGYSTGMRVAITTCTDPTFNASSAVITVTGANTFTYVNPGTDGAAPGTMSVNPLPSFAVGMEVTTTDATPETVYITEVLSVGQSTTGFQQPGTNGFVAQFTLAHLANWGLTSSYLSGTVAANTVATITKAATLSLVSNLKNRLNVINNTFPLFPDNDVIQLFILLSNPLSVQEIKIMFDVGDGSFTQDYYAKSTVMSPAQPVASGTIPANFSQSSSVFQRAGGGIDVRTIGGNDPSLLPPDFPILQQIQAANLAAGANVWSLIQTRLGEFIPFGAAGNPGNSWANVVAWRIQIQTGATQITTVGVDDLVFTGGSDLDSFAGQAYDYRYTFYDINTGTESTPSVIMVATDPTSFALFSGALVPVPLAVRRQAIIIQPQQPTDPQVTHIRIYRRGGTLTQAWYLVDKITVGTLTYIDLIADATIEINDTLNVDADAPVTTLLPTPLNSFMAASGIGFHKILGPGLTTATINPGTVVYQGQLLTVGTANSQEQAYVQSVGFNSLTLYLQLNHGESFGSTPTTPISATTRPQTPMNLMAIAFDKAWLAGDPNNPHVLYYSLTFSPETFPVENSLEIGTPDAPIMSLVELRGMLFVFTTKRIYQVLGAGSAVPTVIPTGCKHGLAAQFAWCVSENVIYYLSYDGVYAFQGGSSAYMTEPTEWIWTGKNLGPVPAIDLTQKSQIVMAYANHEIYVRYVDQAGNSHRLISDDRYGYRWRNDDQSAGNITAMYFSEDTGEFFVGKDDGMVYQDRVNDFDSGGFVGGVQIKNPISFSLQSAQMDQSEVDPTNAKKNKIYNEATLDFDSAGQPVVVSLLFNGGAGVLNGTTLVLGTFSQNGRGQIQMNINAGDGQEAQNVGVLITGAATSVVTLYEVHLRASVQAEARKSWDSWWLAQGVDEWKMTKQIFAEYKASDPAGVFVNVFTDGNMTAPAFTFTLPQTSGTHRASKKIRFPATKYRLIRFIGTSASNFYLYDETQIETRKLGSSKGYERSKISP